MYTTTMKGTGVVLTVAIRVLYPLHTDKDLDTITITMCRQGTQMVEEKL